MVVDMIDSMSRSLSRMSTSSIGSPTSCSSSNFFFNQDSTKRSGKEWWLFAIGKALSQNNGARKGGPNNSSALKNLNSTDSRIQEYKEKYQELTRLKTILDMIKSEYEDGKRFEVVRRYIRLKRTIKHTIMYLNLEVVPDVSHALSGAGCMLLAAPAGVRKPNLMAIPECPRAELSERIHLLKKRIAFIRSQIQQLSEKYQMSKQYMVFQRYRLLKAMVKGILTDCIDLQYNQ